MKRYEYALISGYHGEPLAEHLFSAFKGQNKSFCVITPNYFEYNHLKSFGVNAVYIKDFFPAKADNIEDLIQMYEDRYSCSIYDLIITERSYYGMPYRYLYKSACAYIEAFERFFEEYHIDCVFQQQGGEIIRRAAYLLTKRLCNATLYFGESFIPGYITLYSDEYKTLIKPELKDDIPSENVRKLIHSKITDRPVMNYHRILEGMKGKKSEKLFVLLKAGDYDIILTSLSHQWKTRVKNRLVSLIAEMFYDKPTSDENYIYFPLNVASESELFIRNPMFVKQLNTIKFVSSLLPEGVMLYVKPHPGREQSIKIWESYLLKKMKNVILIRPEVNSYELVKSCMAVVVVSSSVGLESMLLKKPTFVLGKWPYTDLGKFEKVDDFGKFPETLMKYIDSFELSDQDVFDFVKNVWQVSFKGTIFGDREDLNRLVQSIIQFNES